jgi:hypothetical protein
VFDLSTLPISSFTPQSLESYYPPVATLQSIGLISYHEYLAEEFVLYGDSCNHEVQPRKLSGIKREGQHVIESTEEESKKRATVSRWGL